MWSSIRVLAAGAALAMLAGCAPGIKIGEARNVVASGSEFSTGLYHGYLDLAEMEYSEGDYADADYFSEQAIVAASGHEPAPKEARDRDMPWEHKGPAIAGRARLMRALDNGGRTRWPLEAARAQVMFDCWMQEQEEDIQPGHINQCREAFDVAVARLEAALAPPGPVADSTVAEAPGPGQRPSPGPGQQVAAIGAGSGTVAARFVVYFAFDKYDLSPTAKNLIREAIIEAKKFGSRRINLTGHADRAGEVPYNQNLSAERADAVAAAMTAAGIDKSTLGVAALGENAPAVPTPDGVRNYRNRRVEIEITE